MFGCKIANYEMVSLQKDIQFPSLGSFKIIIYGAYNAFGLIGSEENGVAILDNNTMQVLCDRICVESTGYFGPSEKQRQRFQQILQMTESEFLEYINAHPRSRYKLELAS